MCLSEQLAVLHGRKFKDRHYTNTLLSNSFIPAVPIGTIDFCLFIPLPVPLTLAEGQLKMETVGSFFSHTSQTIKDFAMVLKQFELSVLISLWNDLLREFFFYLSRVIKKKLVWACNQMVMNQCFQALIKDQRNKIQIR